MIETGPHSRQTIAYLNGVSYTNLSLGFKEEKSSPTAEPSAVAGRAPVAFTRYFQYGADDTLKSSLIGPELTLSGKKSAGRIRHAACLSLIGCAALMIAGCTRHLQFPPMGDPLPSAVKLVLPPTLKEQSLRYTDSCGQPEQIPFGRQVEEALLEGAHRTFQTVIDEGQPNKTATPYHVVKFDFLDW